MPSLYFGIGSFGSKPFIEKRKAALDAVVMKTVATSLPCLNKDNATIISALVPEGVSISELDREQQDWICDQVRTLLFAGYETTSSALTWALYHLALAPDYLEELQTTATLNGSSPSPLLRCICDESLRRYPISPVMFIRKLETPLETEGGILPKGSLVAPSIVLSHLEQGIWGNDANDWLPHRFQNLKASPFQYYPFGGGLRRCLGASLAILEMQCLIQQVALTSRIKVVSTKIPKLARRGLTLQASCPIVISFESRHN